MNFKIKLFLEYNTNDRLNLNAFMRSIFIIIMNIEYIDSYSKAKQTNQKKEKGTEGQTELSLEIEIIN